MEFDVLGPLQIHARGQPLRVGGQLQQRVLVALLLTPNRVVPLPSLIDAVWDDHPPTTAKRQVQNLVSGLRRTLATGGAPGDVIAGEGPGYRAFLVARKIGYRFGEANALNTLGLVHLRWGHDQETLDHAEQALAIAREIGDRFSEACALDTLGLLFARWGRHGEALGHAERGLAVARDIGHSHLEVAALNSLGEILRAAGRAGDGMGRHRSALTLAREIGDRDEQARALDGIAHALAATGHTDQARVHWQEALSLYADLDVPEVGEIRAHLSALGPPGDGRDNRPDAPPHAR